MAPKVLFVLTSHDKMGDTGKPTGWYLPEFAHPYEVLADHVQVVVASPNGGAAPLDPSSVEAFKGDASATKFLNTKEALWKNTHKLSEFIGHANDYEAIFFVGGHGPMFDLAKDETSHKLINEFWAHNKIVSAVCHGPAALAYVKLPSGQYLLSGQSVTGFSNAEEDQVGLSAAMPFMLEDQLNTASGGKFVKAAEAWGAKVVVSGGGRIITGQNPSSSGPLGQAIYDGIFGQLTTKDEV
ncbi:putative chaperone protein HSP31 [Hyaloscypha bicolor E]|uniref:D-lactate dehydratase n=1 Tax=Hyaloscypha bicolor E TaxID=1095630 RepID=A0A2J6TGC4_9HELO|nr:putative chaperone protein HSP31 [Hyaloscypha bicolor E]PMD62063.1 putative chaperone protein HSP31 [Hyaloscypha bicolor E]